MSCVLHCINSLEVGGIEHGVVSALQCLTRLGSRHQHVLCAFRGGRLRETAVETLRESGVECVVLDRRRRFSLRFFRALRQTVARLQPVIIHAYNPGPAMWTRLLVGGGGQRIIVHCRGIGVFRSRLGRAIERALAGRTSAYVYNSESTRCVWEHFVRADCVRRVVYNGVAAARMQTAEADAGVERPGFRLLTVCRVTDIKWLDAQTAAVSHLLRNGVPDVHLTIVGAGPALSGLKKKAALGGWNECVEFAGYKSSPADYHRRAHVYLCTSYNETFGMSVAEAMRDGMICVAGAVGGPAELIEDGVSGFLVPCSRPVSKGMRRKLPPLVYDPTAGKLREPFGVDLKALIRRLADIRQRYDALGGMRDAARRRIAEHFSLERHCRALDELYDELTPEIEPGEAKTATDGPVG